MAYVRPSTFICINGKARQNYDTNSCIFFASTLTSDPLSCPMPSSHAPDLVKIGQMTRSCQTLRLGNIQMIGCGMFMPPVAVNARVIFQFRIPENAAGLFLCVPKEIFKFNKQTYFPH